jgi:MinD-like ATPase involved in chromosome partitioning or flagellar assembly
MQVSTFYSFKGGVGRTLALVNVATELAKSGRRVLIVDFDLEAPGIDTFNELKPKANQLGIVDFVTRYIQTGTPPAFEEYVYEAPISNSTKVSGKLWVMPSGKRGPEYGAKLAKINWQTLYDKQEGFLLFEDLKSQWQEYLNPDYVLIDSRTGFTEVGGICTRQLPDLVVMLFIPNEQNLLGLLPVVAAIREQNKTPAAKEIAIEFVASNVPTLDDEEDILQTLMVRFGKALHDKKESVLDSPRGLYRFPIIQRYDSLQLLDQSIFVLKRPKSRLAKQYKSVMRTLIEANLGDREGAIDYLKRQLHSRRLSGVSSPAIENRLSEILQRHSSDAEVMMWSGRFYKELANTKEAITILQQSLTLGASDLKFPSHQVRIELAESLLAEQQPSDASEQIKLALNDSSLDADTLRRSILVWQQINSIPLTEISTLKAIDSLDSDDIVGLATAMDVSRAWQSVALDILLPRIQSGNVESDASTEKSLVHYGLLAAIGSGRFDAISQLISYFEKLQTPEIQDLFNAAMGNWALCGHPNPAEFQKVLDRDRNTERELPDANFLQCLAVAFGVVGRREEALGRLANSKKQITSLNVNRFSCWRYIEIDAIEFLKDLDEIERFVNGEAIQPRFLRNDS